MEVRDAKSILCESFEKNYHRPSAAMIDTLDNPRVWNNMTGIENGELGEFLFHANARKQKYRTLSEALRGYGEAQRECARICASLVISVFYYNIASFFCTYRGARKNEPTAVTKPVGPVGLNK